MCTRPDSSHGQLLMRNGNPRSMVHSRPRGEGCNREDRLALRTQSGRRDIGWIATSLQRQSMEPSFLPRWPLPTHNIMATPHLWAMGSIRLVPEPTTSSLARGMDPTRCTCCALDTVGFSMSPSFIVPTPSISAAQRREPRVSPTRRRSMCDRSCPDTQVDRTVLTLAELRHSHKAVAGPSSSSWPPPRQWMTTVPRRQTLAARPVGTAVSATFGSMRSDSGTAILQASWTVKSRSRDDRAICCRTDCRPARSDFVEPVLAHFAPTSAQPGKQLRRVGVGKVSPSAYPTARTSTRSCP
jgi:hypothetical protein